MRVARSADASGVDEHAVIEADEAEGDETRAWSERGNDVVGVEIAITWLHNFEHDAFALFHRFP